MGRMVLDVMSVEQCDMVVQGNMGVHETFLAALAGQRYMWVLLCVRRRA